MLESEMAAAAAGGVTSLVCPPDTDPVLDEPGLVEMLKFRAAQPEPGRLFPLGALTRGLAGEVLTEMAELTEAGCVGFSQADVPLQDTLVLQRALQYAATFGYAVWLRPQDAWLGNGVAANGAVATRLGLSGVPVTRRDDRAADDLRAGARHRRARPPVPPVERRRRRAGARAPRPRACRSPATSASTRCT